MSTLRKLKRKAIAPQTKEAKKLATDYVKREKVARATTLAQTKRIEEQAVAVINTCAFYVLKDVFKFGAKDMCNLSARLTFESECIRDKYLSYEDILDALQAETKWKFPARQNISDKERVAMTASEMADYDANKFLHEAKAKMELMWLWTLRNIKGFASVRLNRFVEKVREREQELTNEDAIAVNEWLKRRGIIYDGFDVNVFNSVKFFAKGVSA